MRPNNIAVAFTAGLVLGITGGCFVGGLLSGRGPSFELTRDVPLRHGGGVPPLPFLRAGQRFDVYMRKGDVNYMRIYVIAYDRDLASNTREVGTGKPTTGAPWDRPSRETTASP